MGGEVGSGRTLVLSTSYMHKHVCSLFPEYQPCTLQAYHSQFNSDDNRLLANMALLPIRTQYKGPAPKSSEFFSVCIFILNLSVTFLYHTLGGRSGSSSAPNFCVVMKYINSHHALLKHLN